MVNQLSMVSIYCKYTVCLIRKALNPIQSNLFVTDTKGTGIGVRIIEVSVLEK